MRALDLCCGPGHFTRMLAENLHFGEVIGVDLSEPMLMKARENAQKENLSDKLKYLADRVTRSDGIIVLLDPVRPSTESTANLYHRIAGQSYLKMGLLFFNKDFRDSLFASWSPEGRDGIFVSKGLSQSTLQGLIRKEWKAD